MKSWIKREDALAIALCLACFVLLYNYVNIQAPVRVPFSPDENGVLSTSRMLLEKGSIFWTSDLNEKYDVKFFRPRQFIEVSDNRYVTVNSVGLAVFLACAMGLHILPFFVPLTGLLGVLGAYGATAEIYGKRAGLLVAATVGTVPTYVFFSNTFMDIVPSVGFFLLSLFAFFRYVRTRKTWQAVLASFLLAIAVFLRTYSALFTAGYVVVLALLRRRLSLRSVAVSIVSFFLFVAPVFWVNLYAYGTPFRFGPTTSIQSALGLAAAQSFTISVYGVAFVNHVAMLAPLLFLMGLLGAIIIFRRKRTEAENAFLAAVGTISIVSFVGFGSLSRTYGFYEVTPVASLTRYLMPIYLLLAVCAYVFLRRLFDLGMRRLSMLMVSILLVTLLAGSFAPNAVPALLVTQQKYSDAMETIRALPENSVVFTRTYDKLLFPVRNVAIVYTSSDLAQNPDLRFLVPIVDLDTDVVPVVRRLLRDGFHVYLTEDVDDLASHLARAGYLMLRMDSAFGLREVFEQGILVNGNQAGSPRTLAYTSFVRSAINFHSYF